MGGSLTVESIQGEGSTFFLKLPLSGDQQIPFTISEPEYTEKKVYHWNNKKILVAEDEYLNFKVIQIALEKTNAEIIRALDGQEAVEAVLMHQDIDLVLMDIQMPRMDGYEALTRIKQINYHLPVIAQTAFAMIEEKGICLKLGFNDYISKPLNITELMIKIDKQLF
ncbi:MAG: response regulator [Cyclobacteriaceae bacterium]|nr:response regulator [Cyclobacteriaceae bacterium]